METLAPMQTLTQSRQLRSTSATSSRKLNSIGTLAVSIILLALTSQCQSSLGLVRGAQAKEARQAVCPRGFFLADDSTCKCKYLSHSPPVAHISPRSFPSLYVNPVLLACVACPEGC